MKEKLIIISLIVVILTSFLGCESQMSNNGKVYNIVQPESNVQHTIDADLIKSIQAFSTNQTDMLFEEDDNVCYSPLSLYHGLSMLACGLDNNLLKQTMDVLGIDDLNSHNQKMRELYQALYNKSEKYNFLIANSIWLQKNMFSDGLRTEIAKYYYGAVNNVNFSDSKRVAEIISQWISDNTDQMLKPEVVIYANDTIAMLVNCLYLSDVWRDDFDERFTKEDTFYLADGNTATAEYMQRTEYSYPYMKDDMAVYVSLPFKNVGEMVFILPNEDIDMESEFRISSCIGNYLNNNLTEHTSKKMSVKIPKISIENDFMLIDYLETLGINFREKENASASELSGVSEVRQGTALELNEFGIKAAAYTSIRADSASFQADDVFKFHLNRPFAFMLLSNEKIPVFIGKIEKP